MEGTVTFENKEIHGLTVRLLWVLLVGLVSIVTTIVLTYSNIKQGQFQNATAIMNMTNTVNLISSQISDQQRIQDGRLANVEQAQRELDIRLTVIETKMGILNRFK